MIRRSALQTSTTRSSAMPARPWSAMVSTSCLAGRSEDVDRAAPEVLVELDPSRKVDEATVSEPGAHTRCRPARRPRRGRGTRPGRLRRSGPRSGSRGSATPKSDAHARTACRHTPRDRPRPDREGQRGPCLHLRAGERRSKRGDGRGARTHPDWSCGDGCRDGDPRLRGLDLSGVNPGGLPLLRHRIACTRVRFHGPGCTHNGTGRYPPRHHQ